MGINQKVLGGIKSLPARLIVGVSGFGGSGKSTFAHELGKLIDAPVVGVDSFMKDNLTKDYRLWEIVDFKRLEHEVLVTFLEDKKVIQYGHFDWGTNRIIESV